MNGSIRHRSPGSWEISVELERDGLGQRKRRYYTVRGTKAVAHRRLRELLAELDKGVSIPSGRIPVRAWLGRWMAEVVYPRRGIGTREWYHDVVERHLKPAIGNIVVPTTNIRTWRLRCSPSRTTGKY